MPVGWVVFLSEEVQDRSECRSDDPADPADLDHQPEVADEAASVGLQIIIRAPVSFIPGQEEGSEEGQRAEQEDESSDPLKIAFGQFGLRVQRIVVRVDGVQALVDPLEDGVEYNSSITETSTSSFPHGSFTTREISNRSSYSLMM